MRANRCLASSSLTVFVVLFISTALNAETFTTSYTDGGVWNTVFAQGFSPSLNATPEPGHSFDDTVHLNQFQFFKSGMQDEAEFIQLAILDNIFYNFFTPLTVDSPELLGLSDNVIVDTFSLLTGDAITFEFDSVPLTFGGDYGAVFVQQGPRRSTQSSHRFGADSQLRGDGTRFWHLGPRYELRNGRRIRVLDDELRDRGGLFSQL